MELRLHPARPAGLSPKCPWLPVALAFLHPPKSPLAGGSAPLAFCTPKARPRRCTAGSLPSLLAAGANPAGCAPSLPHAPPARAGWTRRERCPPGADPDPGPGPSPAPGHAPTCPAGPAPRSPRPAAGAAPAATSSCPYSGAGQGGGSSIPRRPPSCRGGTCSLTGTGGEGRRGWGREKPLARAPSQPSPPPPAPGPAPTGHARRGGRRRPPRGPARARPAPRRAAPLLPGTAFPVRASRIPPEEVQERRIPLHGPSCSWAARRASSGVRRRCERCCLALAVPRAAALDGPAPEFLTLRLWGHCCGEGKHPCPNFLIKDEVFFQFTPKKSGLLFYAGPW